MTEPTIQEQLFQQVRRKIGPEASIAELVADVLHISNDSAYRRIRGETPLVLEEAKALCEAFNLSVDALLQKKNNEVSFLPVQVNNHDLNFVQYLETILEHLKMVASCQQKEVIYLSKDLAFFHNFTFAPLFAFHYFFWMKSILRHPDFLNARYSRQLLTPEIQKLGREIAKVYNEIPSTEIWNTECINSTIAQIEYYREAGYFTSQEDVEEVYRGLVDTIHHIQLQAEWGTKFLPGENPSLKKSNYHLFYNRMVLGDNTILVSANGRKMVYLNYSVLDYMITEDERFCTDIETHLQALMKRATILSKVSEKQRNIFFNILLRKLPGHISTNARTP